MSETETDTIQGRGTVMIMVRPFNLFLAHGCPAHELVVKQIHIPVVTDMRRLPVEDPLVHIHPPDAPLQTHTRLNFLRR
jgi:hypothetical protein